MQLHSESPISQGVGTIVRITDFLETLPVRRQTALKDSAKQLAKIKRTLQAYALARPSVRLALKVLKSKNDKDNWTYAPKHEASVSDAAVKIIGKKATDQCQWLVWDAGIPATQPAFHSGEWQERDTNQDPTYSVEAMIPKAGCGKLTRTFRASAAYQYLQTSLQYPASVNTSLSTHGQYHAAEAPSKKSCSFSSHTSNPPVPRRTTRKSPIRSYA